MFKSPLNLQQQLHKTMVCMVGGIFQCFNGAFILDVFFELLALGGSEFVYLL